MSAWFLKHMSSPKIAFEKLEHLGMTRDEVEDRYSQWNWAQPMAFGEHVHVLVGMVHVVPGTHPGR